MCTPRVSFQTFFSKTEKDCPRIRLSLGQHQASSLKRRSSPPNLSDGVKAEALGLEVELVTDEPVELQLRWGEGRRGEDGWSVGFNRSES